jgi:large subunit ribosomal protein L22
MQITSTYKYARISAFKARDVTRAIQGLPVAAALDIVRFSTKKAAGMVEKTLKSAIANAENNNDLRADLLVVKEATIGEGPTSKRSQPKARGSAGPIRKRTSHIRIVLTDEIKIETRESKRQATKAKKRTAQKGAARKPSAPAAKQEPPAAPEPAPEATAAPATENPTEK